MAAWERVAEGWGCSPCFPRQSPVHKGPVLGDSAPGGSSRAGLLLLCLNAAHLLTRRHPLLSVAAAAAKSCITLMSVPSITIALIFDTWREDAPAREEFIKNTPLTRHQKEPQRDSELEQRTKTFTEVLRRKKGKGKKTVLTTVTRSAIKPELKGTAGEKTTTQKSTKN